jgi:hypothetical protein
MKNNPGVESWFGFADVLAIAPLTQALQKPW